MKHTVVKARYVDTLGPQISRARIEEDEGDNPVLLQRVVIQVSVQLFSKDIVFVQTSVTRVSRAWQSARLRSQCVGFRNKK